MIVVVLTVVALAAVLDTVSYKSEYKEMQYVLCLHLDSIFFFIRKLNVLYKNLHSKMPT